MKMMTVHEFIEKCMDEWMNGCIDEWMNGWMDERMNGWMNGMFKKKYWKALQEGLQNLKKLFRNTVES